MAQGTNTRIIVLTGPECSGKSELSLELGKILHAPVVPEYAREYISGLSRPYQLSDLEIMAKRQLQMEEVQTKKNFTVVVLDTDLLVIYLWAKIKYGHLFTWMEKLLSSYTRREYLLCSPDISWTPDPLRENPFDRQQIFEEYVSALNKFGLKYHVICGIGNERTNAALQALELSNKLLP